MIRFLAVTVLLAIGATSACAARPEPTTLAQEIISDVVDTLEMER